MLINHGSQISNPCVQKLSIIFVVHLHKTAGMYINFTLETMLPSCGVLGTTQDKARKEMLSSNKAFGPSSLPFPSPPSFGNKGIGM